MPERIQLSRAKGWRLPPNTVKVDRTSRWGNPYVTMPGKRPGAELGSGRIAVKTAADAVACFEASITGAQVQRIRAELAGKNLACWCRRGSPCHADVLLRLANESEVRT